MIEVSAVLVALSVILVLARLWANRRVADLERAFRHREHYFTAAEEIVGDLRTPESVIALVLSSAQGIPSRQARVRLIRHLLMARFGRVPVISRRVQEALAAAAEMPAELRTTFSRSGLDLMASVTYQSTLIGPWIRRELKRAGTTLSDNSKHDGALAEMLLFGDTATRRLEAPAG